MSVDCGHLGTMLLLPSAAVAVRWPWAVQLDLLAPDGDRQRQAAECVDLQPGNSWLLSTPTR